ncbi:MAG: lipoyl synthase [Burkholderiales bacterium]|nr:lipoyl synthase [Burkholderiales bacterium]
MSDRDISLRTTGKIKNFKIFLEQGVPLKKPEWLKIKVPSDPTQIQQVKKLLNETKLETVCKQADCPNLCTCFNKKRATFLIMGKICTRRCPFCSVAHGYPDPLDPDEPKHLALTVQKLGLTYTVITSVDRDDLKDGGASHFANCIKEIRNLTSSRVEILVPDFRGRVEKALDILVNCPPDVFNHNIETVPRLYKHARPGGNYEHSLNLLNEWTNRCPQVPAKSGLMVGLGETDDEVVEVLGDLRAHGVSMVTIGQYLAPSNYHIPVKRYVHPNTFKKYAQIAQELGFANCASGVLVRSSYEAMEQAEHSHLLD